MSLETNTDDALRDGMKDTTSSLLRGVNTWTQCYGNTANMVGGRSRMKMVVE